MATVDPWVLDMRRIKNMTDDINYFQEKITKAMTVPKEYLEKQLPPVGYINCPYIPNVPIMTPPSSLENIPATNYVSPFAGTVNSNDAWSGQITCASNLTHVFTDTTKSYNISDLLVTIEELTKRITTLEMQLEPVKSRDLMAEQSYMVIGNSKDMIAALPDTAETAYERAMKPIRGK